MPTRSRVVRLVIGQSLRATGAAVALGIALAAVVAPRMQSLLFAESALDVVVYAVVAGAVLAAALVASLAPAMRAAGMDPNIALRAD